jgi:hypothetical protein
MTLEELRVRKSEILEIVRQYGGVLPVRVFGSTARGDARDGSDVDLLVELEPGRSLVDRVHLQDELTRRLGTRVDAVSPRGLYHVIRAQVLAEAVVL